MTAPNTTVNRTAHVPKGDIVCVTLPPRRQSRRRRPSRVTEQRTCQTTLPGLGLEEGWRWWGPRDIAVRVAVARCTQGSSSLAPARRRYRRSSARFHWLGALGELTYSGISGGRRSRCQASCRSVQARRSSPDGRTLTAIVARARGRSAGTLGHDTSAQATRDARNSIGGGPHTRGQTLAPTVAGGPLLLRTPAHQQEQESKASDESSGESTAQARGSRVVAESTTRARGRELLLRARPEQVGRESTIRAGGSRPW
jgi:hypothetical protein